MGYCRTPKPTRVCLDSSEWHPWLGPEGDRPGITPELVNEMYIPIKGVNPQPFDYPAALQGLTKFLKEHKPWQEGQVDHTVQHGGSGLLLGASPARLAGGLNVPESDLWQRRRDAFGPNASWSGMKEIKLVASYTFRGETRTPEQIHAAGGFYPPSMRTDFYYQNIVMDKFAEYLRKVEGKEWSTKQIKELLQEYWRQGDNRFNNTMLAEFHMWKAMFQREEAHIGKMTESPFLKGYVSTTRDMGVAVFGSTGGLATDQLDVAGSENGWVYAVRVEPGFLLRPGAGGVKKDEAEVAHLGPIPWDHVYGFRCFAKSSQFNGRVFIRYDFDKSDTTAFKLILRQLSMAA